MATFFFAFTVTLLSFAILYAPWVFLDKSEIISGEHLKTAHPQFWWVRWALPVVNIVAIFSFIFLTSFIARNDIFVGMHKENSEYFLGTIFAVIAIINGLFNLITGVCPVPANRIYLYAHTDKSRAVGLLQLSAGVAMVAAIYLLFTNYYLTQIML